MTEFSYPFDGGSGAILTEDDWSDMARNWQDDGVIDYGGSPAPLALSTHADRVTLSPGTAMVQGFMYRNTADLDLSFSPNSSGMLRRDRVVLRLNRNTNIIQAVVLEGTPAVSPVPPALNTTYPIYEIPLTTFSVGIDSLPGGGDVSERKYVSRYVKYSRQLTGHPRGSLIYNPADDTFYGVRGTDLIAFGEGGGGDSSITYIYKPTDSGNLTGSTAVLDPHLTYTIPATGVYVITSSMYMSCNTGSQNVGAALIGSSAPAMIKATYRTGNAVWTSAHDTGLTFGSPSTPNAVTAVETNATVQMSSGQTIGWRTANHNATWKVLQGSYMRVERIS